MFSALKQGGGFLMRLFGASSANRAAQQKEIRMCVLGLDNAGKTTILRALAHEEIHTVQPTQGFNVKTLQVANFRFNVWDLGGQ